MGFGSVRLTSGLYSEFAGTVGFHLGRLDQPVGLAHPRALQPPSLAERRKLNSRRGIPSLRAITGAELHRDFLVAIRNPQRRRGCGI